MLRLRVQDKGEKGVCTEAVKSTDAHKNLFKRKEMGENKGKIFFPYILPNMGTFQRLCSSVHIQ